ncbi:hypothetical protein EMCRGX_G016059 [Ephydatia muelleri]|eukprot:Em0008g1127a
MSDCTCFVCSKLLVDPRILPCLHTVCRSCLEGRNPPSNNQGSVRCPKCLRTFPVAAGALTTNVHVDLEAKVVQALAKMTDARHGTACEGCRYDNPSNELAKAFCADCNEMICQQCWDQHKRHLSLKKHKILPCGAESSEALRWLLRATEYRCTSPGHEEEEWSVYCNTCSRLICQSCALQSHKEHQCGAIDAVSKTQREETVASLSRARETMAKLKLAVEDRRATAKEMETNAKSVTLAITAAFEELENALKQRKNALLAKLETVVKTPPSATAVTLQEKEFERAYKELSDYSETTARILQTHTDVEMLALKSLLPVQLQAAIKTCESAQLCRAPHNSAVLSLDTTRLLKLIQQLGEVEECSPPHSTWTQSSPETPACMNTPHQVRVETRNPTGEKLTGGGLQLKGELVHLSTKSAVMGEVEDHRNGTYTLSFTPTTPGSHQLRLTLQGEHLANSPSELYVNRDYTASTPVVKYFTIRAPSFIAVRNDSRELYVSNDLVHVVDGEGKERLAIGGVGSGEGQFNGPQGIAIHGDVMYVADRYNHRIQKMTVGGEFLQAFGQGQSAGVCVDPKSGRIIAANGQNNVLVFNAAGTLVQSISGSTSGGGSFSFPHGVAVDPQGNIHVAARKSSSIKVFSAEGSFVRAYGNLIEPTGIAIDRGGYCLVCEMYTSLVTVFDPNGKLVAKIQTCLLKQLAVAVDLDGSVYVSSSDDNVVVKL